MNISLNTLIKNYENTPICEELIIFPPRKIIILIIHYFKVFSEYFEYLIFPAETCYYSFLYKNQKLYR